MYFSFKKKDIETLIWQWEATNTRIDRDIVTFLYIFFITFHVHLSCTCTSILKNTFNINQNMFCQLVPASWKQYGVHTTVLGIRGLTHEIQGIDQPNPGGGKLKWRGRCFCGQLGGNMICALVSVAPFLCAKNALILEDLRTVKLIPLQFKTTFCSQSDCFKCNS